MACTLFGTMPAGEAVRRIAITGGGLTAHILTYGAVLQDLRLEGHRPPLVLGFDNLPDYLNHSPHFGATPGRFSNRIARARYTFQGRTVELEANENGNHLHGGSAGLGRRNWQVTTQTDDSVTLSISVVDGDMGYPGECTVETTYRLKPGGELSIMHVTRSDKAAPANITHHSYFNLDGATTILNHELALSADHYLPTDAEQIPTGEIAPVAGTVFDFRQMRAIGLEGGPPKVNYDHNFCVARQRRAMRPVALARGVLSGVEMATHSTEPGVQFYCGHKIGVPVKGLQGREYGPYAGFCLETQNWPDAPNHPEFPPCFVEPGVPLRQETSYIFKRR
ncbi:aldose epimerase family protein [Pararhizobium haloflavum]|uniref:aldose epimerase family protein n=1 Tax=Pararhizobium haloflavum TaxID=2037914 RepID=UPI000C17466D|nr:aldose epimerase family protein [Pararhizobium haloflavum]